jgi:predicted transposase YbfD/YdcC
LLQTAATTEKSRGRWEKRTVTTTTNLIDSGYLDWPGAAQLIRLERETKIGDKARKTVTYAITSLSREKADAKLLLKSLRGRWSIENSCFYVLDTALAEDHCRVRSGNSGHALSIIRHAVLNFCRHLRRSAGEILREHAVKIDVLLSRLRIYKK